jgi:hypothetical protein
MREFVDVEVVPEARAGELSDTRPSQELIKKMSAAKILHMRLGPGKHLVSMPPSAALMLELIAAALDSTA